MIEKVCSKCGLVKPISDFHKRKANHDGFSGICKNCANTDKQSKRWKYAEHELVYSRDYYKKNKDKIRTKTHDDLLNRRAEEGAIALDKFNKHSIQRSIEHIDAKIWEETKGSKTIIGIYMIRSLMYRDRIYIGSSVDILQRWVEHKSDLLHNKHHNPKLQNHYNKYGDKDLVFYFVEICNRKNIIKREQYYIDLINPYFNINKIAGNSLGYKPSKATKKKIGDANRKKVVSDETKKKQSEAHKGISKTQEWKDKIGEGNKGKKHTKKSKLKISKSKAGKKLNLSEEQRRKRSENARRVFGWDKD